MNYRNTARLHCEVAKALLSNGCDDDTLFAALKLRLALECIIYDRAVGFAEDLGPDVMKTWQPRKLMEQMLEVDPEVDSDSTLSFGVESVLGRKPEVMQMLGTDPVLKMRVLKRNYDALGSYLHTPTIAQVQEGREHDFAKLRDRCSNIIKAMEETLNSTVWNSTIATRGEIRCEVCDDLIRRRLPSDCSERVVSCWSCSASYTMIERTENRVHFKPRQIEVTCPEIECDGKSYIWERDVVVGNRWTCSDCDKTLTFSMGVSVST